MHNLSHSQGKNEISKKKPFFKIMLPLRNYLKKYNRVFKIPITYTDLTHYAYAAPLLDKQGKDTLWETVYYSNFDREELYPALTMIYVIIKANGDASVMEHLYVERVDYCTFGNSNPFRVKIVNNFNDNYDYFYVKVADSSRVYGLELEHILSPNRIGYIVHKDTLIEEHIAGIPGDQFISQNFQDPMFNETRIAKEFIKFNERCFVKLLGDMRAYNFVIDITPDFDDVQYRIRAIDFDQQCYEARKNLYLPQFFKENYPFVKLCIKRMTSETVRQYQLEERTLIAKRIKSARHQLNDLFSIMKKDTLSTQEKIIQLKKELAAHYEVPAFQDCKNMGEILQMSLRIVLQKNSPLFSE